MKAFRGVIKNQEQAQIHAVRDLRAFHRRFGDLLASRQGACVCIGLLSVLSFIFPYLADIFISMMIAIFGFQCGHRLHCHLKSHCIVKKQT